MNWSALIRQRRENLQLTQMELAVKSGVSLPSIQNMEAGRANPSLKTLESVFETLGVGIEFTILEKEETEPTTVADLSSVAAEHLALFEEPVPEKPEIKSKGKDKTKKAKLKAKEAKEEVSWSKSRPTQDLGEVLWEVGSELGELTRGSAMERAEKLVQIFGKITDARKR